MWDDFVSSSWNALRPWCDIIGDDDPIPLSTARASPTPWHLLEGGTEWHDKLSATSLIQPVRGHTLTKHLEAAEVEAIDAVMMHHCLSLSVAAANLKAPPPLGLWSNTRSTCAYTMVCKSSFLSVSVMIRTFRPSVPQRRPTTPLASCRAQ